MLAVSLQFGFWLYKRYDRLMNHLHCTLIGTCALVLVRLLSLLLLGFLQQCKSLTKTPLDFLL